MQKALFSSEGATLGGERGEGERGRGLQRMVVSTMIRWAQQPIHCPCLIQQIFTLLYRQFDEINEVVSGILQIKIVCRYIHYYLCMQCGTSNTLCPHPNHYNHKWETILVLPPYCTSGAGLAEDVCDRLDGGCSRGKDEL